jgi:hypothetical protein
MSNLTILGHEPSSELLAFKKDFQDNTGIKVEGLIESKDFFHWKRLVFYRLNCDDMFKIHSYIKRRFSKPGIYTHLSVELVTYDGYMCLTADVSKIKEFILKIK